MASQSERSDDVEELPQLREPDDPDNPDPDVAPFDLQEARPLSQSLGDYLTSPTVAGDDANPDVVLQHAKNPEFTVWIARFRSGDGVAYVLTCWDFEREIHFDVPKETVANVVEQAAASAYWTFDIPDDDLLENFVQEL